MKPRTILFIWLAANLILIILVAKEARCYEFFTPLSSREIKLQIGFTVITAIDWMQTKEFRAQGVKEQNPILGEEPSQEKVDTYIGAAIISHALVTWALPPEFRETWIWTFIIIESVAVLHNYDQGYGPNLNLTLDLGFNLKGKP